MSKIAALATAGAAPLHPRHFAFANRGYPAERTVIARRRSPSDGMRRDTRNVKGRQASLPRTPALADGTSSVMIATVGAVKQALGKGSALSLVEIACAETYRQPADRERYLAARGLLRHALSKAVGGRIAPRDWSYREGPHGKPIMAAGLPPLQFNVSHSGDCVAVAVSMRDPIGIDIECIDPDRKIGIVDEILTDVERDALAKCDDRGRDVAFMRMWTAKEACAKALGLGFSLDVSRVEVRIDPLRVRMLDTPGGDAEPFDIAGSMLSRNSRRYAVAVARLVDRQS